MKSPKVSFVTIFIFSCASFYLTTSLMCADGTVRSTSANIRFDVHFDQSYEMVLTQTGLGVGVLQPSQALDVNGNLLISGNLSCTDLNARGNVFVESLTLLSTGLIVNELSADKDFRVEGSSNAYLLYTDAERGLLGIGTASPSEQLSVSGNIIASGNIASANIISTSNVIVPDGSLSAPSIAFENDTNTGMFFGASIPADNITFYTNGAEVFRVNSDTLYFSESYLVGKEKLTQIVFLEWEQQEIIR